METQQYVTWFRHSSPYINKHRGKTFVLMLPGEAVAHDNFANIIHDIALLNSLGVKLVICHGARYQIEQLHAEQSTPDSLDSVFHKDLRITDSISLETVKAAAGMVKMEIEAMLSYGLPNSPMHGAKIRVCSGNLVTAQPIGVLNGIDYQHTGKVRKIDIDAIKAFLNNGSITLISPIGFSATGEIFNVSMAEIAVNTAIALQADKLIAYDHDSGVLNEQQQLIHQLSLQEAKLLCESRKPPHRLAEAMAACESGVQRCHLISYQEDGALLQELFTRDGAGTLLSYQQYETIRTATINDVGGILELIEPLEADGTLVKRSRELLENEISFFTVVERDGAVIACAALYPYERGMAELACVVTHKEYRDGGRASLLLQHIENQARHLHIETLFVLTTRTAHWFLEQGFVEQPKSALPEKKRQLYNLQRNSKIFIKALN